MVYTFYKTHNPEKVESVDRLLSGPFHGREDELIRMLHQKYSVPMVRTPHTHLTARDTLSGLCRKQFLTMHELSSFAASTKLSLAAADANTQRLYDGRTCCVSGPNQMARLSIKVTSEIALNPSSLLRC